jgi:hypothetical protein
MKKIILLPFIMLLFMCLECDPDNNLLVKLGEEFGGRKMAIAMIEEDGKRKTIAFRFKDEGDHYEYMDKYYLNLDGPNPNFYSMAVSVAPEGHFIIGTLMTQIRSSTGELARFSKPLNETPLLYVFEGVLFNYAFTVTLDELQEVLPDMPVNPDEYGLDIIAYEVHNVHWKDNYVATVPVRVHLGTDDEGNNVYKYYQTLYDFNQKKFISGTETNDPDWYRVVAGPYYEDPLNDDTYKPEKFDTKKGHVSTITVDSETSSVITVDGKEVRNIPFDMERLHDVLVKTETETEGTE